MNRIGFIFSVAVAAAWWSASMARADVPATLSYAGHLTSDDLAVDGTVDAVFELYTEQSTGTAVWSESHIDVVVDNGLLSVELGGINDLTGLLTGSVYWLQVTVDGQEMVPRTPFNSVPYARKAAESDTVGGYTPSELMSNATPSGAHVSYDNSASGMGATDMQAAIDELMAEIVTLKAENRDQQKYIEDNAGKIRSNREQIDTTQYAIAANASAIATHGTNIGINAGDIHDLQSLTASMSIVGDDIYFTGVNVNVVSGSGATDGAVNGVGNLIVGYNEERPYNSFKSGSHNLVVGPYHNFNNYGGLVAGYANTVTGWYGTVSGGYENTASHFYTSVCGGQWNTASGPGASVSGGSYNTAAGTRSSISGGRSNSTLYQSHNTWIGGGEGNEALGGEYSRAGGSVCGGLENSSSGFASSVSGGYQNSSEGNASSISGGSNNIAEVDGYYTWIGGGAINKVSGGDEEAAGGSISGGRINVASGDYSSISGGSSNRASNYASSVSGGQANRASGFAASVSGGVLNKATGNSCSISGGRDNTAHGSYSAVHGGYSNETQASYSTISGGYDDAITNTGAHTYDWRAGDLYEAD